VLIHVPLPLSSVEDGVDVCVGVEVGVGVGISTGLNVGPMNIYSDSCVKSSIYKLEVPVIEPKANAILDPSGDQAASKMS